MKMIAHTYRQREVNLILPNQSPMKIDPVYDEMDQ